MVCYPSRWYEDVQGPEVTILVVWLEEGCGRVCGTLLHLSVGEGGASVPCRIVATTTGVRVEVGPHHYGLYVRFTTDQQGP